MKDRLAELTAGTDLSSDSELEEIDLENGGEDDLDEEDKKALAQYHRETDAILKAVDKIHENVETIESRYQISLNDKVQESDKAIASNDIAHLMGQTEKTSEAVRKRLRRIAGENKAFRQEHPEKVGTLRVRVNTHQGLTRRFMDAMQLFEESQERHRDNVRSAMEGQLRLMNPQATEEEIQEALRNGSVDDVVDDSPTLAQLPPEEQTRLRNGLADLRSRNNDIKKLEESIIQLHQLFVDMQILVEAQGELLNDIEYNIEETKGKTETGYQELIQARAHQKSATKKKICIAFLIIAVIVAIAVPILVKYIPIWFPETADTINNLPIVGGGSNTTDSVQNTNGNEGVAEGGTETDPTQAAARIVMRGIVGRSLQIEVEREPLENEQDVSSEDLHRFGSTRGRLNGDVAGGSVVGNAAVWTRAGGSEEESVELGRRSGELSRGGTNGEVMAGGGPVDASILMQVINDVSGVGVTPAGIHRHEWKTNEDEKGESADYADCESAMDVVWEFIKERITREIDRMRGLVDEEWEEDEDEGDYVDLFK